MIRRRPALPVALVGTLVLTACATVPSPAVVAVPAGADALRCGTEALDGMGYLVREAEPGVVEATRNPGGVESGTDRHRVELRLDDRDPPALVATVTRWRYGPSQLRPDMERRALNQASPDGAEVAAVRAALERCSPGGAWTG